MKTCPICQSVAFDDAETCYGCLYDFGRDEQEGALAANAEGAPANPGAPSAKGPSASFVITLTPEGGVCDGMSWSCTVRAVEP